MMSTKPYLSYFAYILIFATLIGSVSFAESIEIRGSGNRYTSTTTSSPSDCQDCRKEFEMFPTPVIYSLITEENKDGNIYWSNVSICNDENSLPDACEKIGLASGTCNFPTGKYAHNADKCYFKEILKDLTSNRNNCNLGTLVYTGEVEKQEEGVGQQRLHFKMEVDGRGSTGCFAGAEGHVIITVSDGEPVVKVDYNFSDVNLVAEKWWRM